MEATRMNNFRERLLAGSALIGTWVKTPSPIVAEVLAQTALDVLAFDAEHAPFGRAELDSCLALTRAGHMPSLVRVARGDGADILNALDCGADGVIVPHVTTAAQAEQIARACRYGRGGRGFAGSSRSAEYGAKSMADQIETAKQSTVCIAQIEDVEAIDVIDDIAAIEGIDCLFIGRIDLTVALSADSPNAPEVVDAVKRVCEAGQKANRRIGMFVSDPEEVSRWREMGASLFLLSSDHGFLKSGAERLAGKFRD